MRKSTDNRKKKFLALCLSAMMMASVGALASCKDDTTADSSESSSSAATSAVVDDYIIKNAGFETASESALNPITTSPTGWTRSVSSATSGTALASKSASGILDLDETAWANLTSSKLEALGLNLKTATEETVKDKWDELTVRDKLAYYEIWEEANKDKDIKKDLSFYEEFNIDTGDIPQIARFSTHYAADDTANAGKTKVLMLHNQYPEEGTKTIGTAQKFTSSSTVTIPAGTSAEFSVWVKTLDLKTSATDGSVQLAVDRGAYISLTPSVGGATAEEYRVENINTELMDAATLSNGWKQYSFYLKGSSYSTTTFSLVLGLGQGGGTDRYEYVNGYAFFDDVQCKIIENSSFDSAVTDTAKADAFGTFVDELGDKVVDVAKAESATKNAFAIDFYGDFAANEDVLKNVTAKATETETAEGVVTSLATQNPAKWLSGGFNGTNDITATFADLAALKTATEEKGNPYLSKIYTEHFENNAYLKKIDTEYAQAIADEKTPKVDKQILLLLSADGVAYTAESSYKFQFSSDVEYMAISFFLKTSDLNGYTGAGITLVDGNDKTSFTSLDTTSIVPVETDTNEDLYAGWQQCFFFVKNASEKDDASFTLTFNFGHTSIEESNAKDSYHEGFVAFTNFQVLELDKKAYDRATSGTYSKVVSVKAGNEEASSSGTGFDTTASVPSDDIKNGLANAQNYKGVYTDSQYVNPNGTTTVINTHENAGLLSKEYFTADDGYFETATGAWMDGIKTIAGANATTATAVWDAVFGKSASQPYFIWNDLANKDKAYGLVGKSTQIAANTCTPISLRVKVGNTDGKDATASIYLIDTDDDSYQQNLSIGAKTIYWYDDDGNLCTGDPSDKTTKVAFRLQSNGLYKANKSWSGYESLENKDAFYANLGAYAKDADGNRIVAENGASHDYSEYWNNEGVDGIAFYHKDGKYYADRAKTVEVLDIASTDLPTRYDAQANRELVATVTDSDGTWKTITFYVQTGELAKNYRLEVWSGVRNGAGNPENSYVIVDQNNPSTDDVSTTFTNLINEYKDVVAEEDKFESIFSYFDTDNYLRYNANLDERGYGNLYKDNYVPSEQTSGVAYLKYEDDDDLIVLADYSYSEKTVTASEPDIDNDEDSSSDDAAEDTNVWLLASSLSIAAILVFAVISIAVRKIIKKSRKKRGIR